MLYLRITENSQQARAFAQYIKTLPFVEIVEQDDDTTLTKEQLLADIRKSFEDVKAHRTKPIKELLHGK